MPTLKIVKRNYPRNATKHDTTPPPDYFGTYLSEEAAFACGHSNMRLPEIWDDISLKKPKDVRKYVFYKKVCEPCAGWRYRTQLTTASLLNYLSRDAEFSCNHLHWKLPLEAEYVRLRMKTVAHIEKRIYVFPIECYNCRFQRMVERDRELEAHYHYNDQLDVLQRRIDMVSTFLEQEYPEDISSDAKIKADPATERLEALIEEYNSLGATRFRKWELYWGPFKRRWGPHKSRDRL